MCRFVTNILFIMAIREKRPKTKLKKVLFQNDIKLKEAVTKVEVLCNDREYMKLIKDPALVPLMEGTISGLSSGRKDIMYASVKTIVRLCNGLGCTPNDIIPNPLNENSDW